MNSDGIDKSRRRFLSSAASVVGAVGAAFVAVPFVGSWLPSQKAEAAGAPVIVDISKLEPAAQITVAWRGKPVFIVRRTEAELNNLPSLNDELRDPNSVESEQPEYAKNINRSLKPEYLVLIAVCTHLGCVPAFRPEIGSVEADWRGGFFCPCHGSKYDMAGRVYKGVPAPLNLPVPPYHFMSDTIIEVGESSEGGAA